MVFIKKNSEGYIKLSTLIKICAGVISLLITVGGALFFIDDRYVSANDIKDIEMRIEKNTVDTFEKQQRILDIRYLEQLQCQKALMEKELVRDPNDRLIKDKLERINRTIQKVEDTIYQ